MGTLGRGTRGQQGGGWAGRQMPPRLGEAEGMALLRVRDARGPGETGECHSRRGQGASARRKWEEGGGALPTLPSGQDGVWPSRQVAARPSWPLGAGRGACSCRGSASGRARFKRGVSGRRHGGPGR